MLANLPDRFSRAILFYERDGVLNNKFAELKINFKPLMSQAKGECHFLKALIDIDQKHLLKHPLCESFLHMKWMKVRKFLFWNVMYYLLFCVLLSVYVLGTCQDNCYNIGRGIKLGLCTSSELSNSQRPFIVCEGKGRNLTLTCEAAKAGTTHFPDACKCFHSSFMRLAVDSPSFYTCLWYVLLVFDFTLAAKELFQLAQDPPQYFRNPENLAEWALMLFLILIGTPLLGYIDTWQKHLGALSVLICWFELMMLVGRLPRLGLYIHMFSKVLKDFFQFLLAYASLAIGFAVAFAVLFPHYPPVGDPWRSTLKVLVMMTGELEFGDMFYPDNDDDTILNPTASLVFTAFLFVMTIILMNLLVGLAVSDIQGLQRTAKLGRLVRLTEQMTHIEFTLFSKVMTRLLPEKMLKCIADMALVSPSSYRYTLVLRPNDPNDTRLTRDIMNSACRVAKRYADKESRKVSKFQRQFSAVSYDYDLLQSVEMEARAEEHTDDEGTARESTKRDLKLQTLEAKMEVAQSALGALLIEVRAIAQGLNTLSERHGLPPVRLPRPPRPPVSSSRSLDVDARRGRDAAPAPPTNGEAPARGPTTPSTSLEEED